MNLYSYVVARDFGFAPNPFHGYCSLATCKPQIRKHASIGDLIVGTGSAEHKLQNRIVFIMKVDEKITFDEYWNDERFYLKRPNLRGSIKQAYGDNIYHHDEYGQWIQENSHHSLVGGGLNEENLKRDTRTTQNVLIGSQFSYWGGEGPKIPDEFMRDEFDIRAGRGHKCKFSEDTVKKFEDWYLSLNQYGFLGEPKDFTQTNKNLCEGKYL